MLSNSRDTVLKCLRFYKYKQYTLKILLECGLRLGHTSIKGIPKRSSGGQIDHLSYGLNKFHLVHKDTLLDGAVVQISYLPGIFLQREEELSNFKGYSKQDTVMF